MIDLLVNTIGKWKLGRRYANASRKPVAINLLYMKTAVLVFHISDENHYHKIISFGESLKTKEGFSKVYYVAYVATKEVPSFVNSEKVKIFDSTQVNIYGIPKDEFASAILKTEVDLMIDFTEKSFVPTDYFLALIQAKTKVGLANPEKEYIFDLMIEISDNQNITEFATQVIRYLKMINKD